MSFRWERQCFQCGRPVDVYFDDNGCLDTMIKSMAFFIKNPIDLDYNVSLLKFYGMKVKRVCFGCFQNKLHFNPNVMRERETGMKPKRQILPKIYTRTTEQICRWNLRLDKDLKNSV